jgi:hypothetical protein
VIGVREDDGHPLAVVSGDIDESASAALTCYVDRLLDFDDADVVGHLGVTFIDSRGLKAVLGALERASEQAASGCPRTTGNIPGGRDQDRRPEAPSGVLERSPSRIDIASDPRRLDGWQAGGVADRRGDGASRPLLPLARVLAE